MGGVCITDNETGVSAYHTDLNIKYLMQLACALSSAYTSTLSATNKGDLPGAHLALNILEC